MVHQLRFTAEKIAKRIDLIRPHVLRRKAVIEPFRLTLLPHAGARLDQAIAPPRTVPWNSFWARQDSHFHLASSFVVPKDWPDPALHLPLGKAGDIFTHPEALMSIDGEPVGSADRYHHTTPLAAHLADGRAHRLELGGWTGLTGWPPDPADRTKLFISECAVVDVDRTLEALIIKAEVALDVANHLGDERHEKHRLLNALDAAFKALDTRSPLKETLRASAPDALRLLDEGIDDAGIPIDIDLVAIGHGHIDIAYLWPVSQGRKKAARTVANMLRLMARHDDVHFSQSQPQLYAFLERDQPQMFERVRQRVIEGRFEPMGGMWVEADTNLPGAEALVRQLLLGRMYFRRTFGEAETPVLWLPDCFGFTWSLPQLMKQAGLRWFVTNKLGWNQYNPMPASTTWWQGIDGTRILAHFLTTPREVQHLPFPTCYKSDLSAREVIGTWEQCRGKSTAKALPICFGYGDGGGGPTETLIAKARAYGRMPGAPRLRMGTVREIFEQLEERQPDLPVWNGELYMEGHRGVLTSQARLKRGNRRSEAALHEAEFLLCLAGLHAGHPVPKVRLRELWQALCLNQFHDILPGCGTREVVKEAQHSYHVIEGRARKLTGAAIDALAETFDPKTRWLALNASPFAGSRHGVIDAQAPGVVDLRTGGSLRTQAVDQGLLVEIPDMAGYGCVALADGPAAEQEPTSLEVIEDDDHLHLSNDLIAITLSKDGLLTRIFDRQANRDVLAKGDVGNQLQVFEDRPLSWDAWDIDVFFDDRPAIVDDVVSIEVLERGPLRATVKMETGFRQSRIVQQIQLHHDSRRIDFVTEVDWHQQHHLLKVAFPVDILCPTATFEIQWGHIERPTHRNTSWDFARFEVPAQKWADLSEGDYGVALLNDCKHGYDVLDNVLRLSLIKSATMPDPKADQGQHRFTYSLLPHIGDWTEEVPSEAYALNAPAVLFPVASAKGGSVCVGIVRSLERHAVIETIKPAEDGEGLIIRLFEAERKRGPVTLQFETPPTRVMRCNLLEEFDGEVAIEGDAITLDLRPFEIVTLRCVM